MTAAYCPEAEASKGIGSLARGGARENNGGTVRSRSAPGSRTYTLRSEGWVEIAGADSRSSCFSFRARSRNVNF